MFQGQESRKGTPWAILWWTSGCFIHGKAIAPSRSAQNRYASVLKPENGY